MSNALIIKLKNNTTLISDVEEVDYIADASGRRSLSIVVDESSMLHLINPMVLMTMEHWIPEINKVNGNYIIPINYDNILTVGEPNNSTKAAYLTAQEPSPYTDLR